MPTLKRTLYAVHLGAEHWLGGKRFNYGDGTYEDISPFSAARLFPREKDAIKKAAFHNGKVVPVEVSAHVEP